MPLSIFKRAILSLRYRGLLNWMPDKAYLKLMFRVRTGKKLNLKNPTTFNEKLQWIKLYDRNPEYCNMVDKHEVKKYVAEIIGRQYIIPTLGVWNKFDDIDFDLLPNQFVLKCTHDSGGLVICRDKSKLDLEAACAKIKKSLATNYYLHGREWPYKSLNPRIIAEKYMVDDSGTELRDYKVMCFNGKPRLIQYHMGRYKYHTQDFYDTEWNKLEISQGCPLSEEELDKPIFLEEMLELSEKLSVGIPHVRIDWYYVQGQLYFGEITFFDASGFDEFEPEKWNKIIGGWCTLPQKIKR